MADPIILSSYDGGRHNADLEATVSRIDRESSWKDLSTIIVIPAGGQIATRVVAAWWSLITPPNNRVVRLFAVGMEVGAAYESCFSAILDHPDLGTWKYILTLEWDNIPPPDALIKLQQRMEANPEYSAIGSAYFTKGFSGVLQAWGDPDEFPVSFKPRKPILSGGLLPCVGTGMGCTLFRIEMFRDTRLRRPWFKTIASKEAGVGTQDLYFWGDAFKHGHKAAIDLDVKTGHYSREEDIVW